MSGMVTMMEWFASGSESDTSKDLCKDFETDKVEKFYTNISCSSLGDYAARIISTLPKENNPGIYISSGVIVYNLMVSKSFNRASGDDNMNSDKMEDFGVKIDATFKFPYKVVYMDAWEIKADDTVYINMLDKKVAKRKDFYIIARADGKKPTKSEINKYKQKVRQQIVKAKRSDKFKDFQEFSPF